MKIMTNFHNKKNYCFCFNWLSKGTTYKELFRSNPLTSEEDTKCNCDTLQDCSNCEDNEEYE